MSDKTPQENENFSVALMLEPKTIVTFYTAYTHCSGRYRDNKHYCSRH